MPSATSACAIRDNPQALFSLALARAQPGAGRRHPRIRSRLQSDRAAEVTRPYSERVIHGEIFKARPDVNAVCHHHAPSIMPFAISGVPLVPVFHLGAAMGRSAPFWDSRDEFGDTNLLVVKPEEGASLARALGKHAIVVMRRHGATVVGGALRELVFRTHLFGQECRASAGRAHARPRLAAHRRRSRHGGRRLNLAPGPLARAYEYWVRRLAEREGRSKNDPMLRAAEAAARLPVPAGEAGCRRRKAGAKKKSRGRKK